MDLKTGVPAKDAKYSTHQDYNAKGICPSQYGAKAMNPTAYSPKTKLLYVPLIHTCMTFEPVESKYVKGQPWVGSTLYQFPGKDGVWGGFVAIDLFTNKPKWYNKEKYASSSGILATVGNLIFFGTGDRWFKALDAKSGSELWNFQLGSSAVGNAFSYGLKGKQYVGVFSGVGGIVTSFWGDPIHVAALDSDMCIGPFGPVEKDYVRTNNWNDSCRGSIFGAGALNIFSL